MKCPFCTEQLDAEAIVCKTCGRDVSVPRPVMQANQDLEFRVEELEGEVARLTLLVKQTRVIAALDHFRLLGGLLATYVLLPIAILIAIHAAFVVWLDVPVWLLNFAFAPPAIVFGYLLETTWRPRWRWIIALSLLISIASLFGMAVVVFFTDNSPIVPTNWVEWKLNGELGLNIGFALLLGALIAAMVRASHHGPKTEAEGVAGALALAIARVMPHKKGMSLEKRLAHWHRVVRGAMSVATAVGMILSGVSRFHLHQ